MQPCHISFLTILFSVVLSACVRWPSTPFDPVVNSPTASPANPSNPTASPFPQVSPSPSPSVSGSPGVSPSSSPSPVVAPSPTNIVLNGAWHDEARIDSNPSDPAGWSEAALSPSGELWVFYSRANAGVDFVYVKKRASDYVNWQTEKFISSYERIVRPYFDSTGDIYVSLEDSTSASIYKSVNNGANWSHVKTYAATDTFTAFLPSFLVSTDQGIRLIFNYCYNTVLFGPSTTVASAIARDGVWTSASLVRAPVSMEFYHNIVAGELAGAYFQDGKIMMVLYRDIIIGNSNLEIGSLQLTDHVGSLGDLPRQFGEHRDSLRNDNGEIYVTKEWSWHYVGMN